jgi:hypothetical protein
MKAIGDLHRLGRPLAGTLGVRPAPVTADDLHFWMLVQPRRQDLRRAIGQQVDHLLRLQVHQDGSIRPPAPVRPVIHA